MAMVYVVSGLVAAAYCSESIAAAMLGPMLPDLARERGLDVSSLAILIPAYNAGGSIGAACGGMS